MSNPNNHYVSEAMFASRITAKGKITSLTEGFKLKGGVPFSLYVRPKTLTTMERDVLLDCRLLKDEASAPVPVSLFGWNELAITEIAPNALPLDSYDMWWGSGDYAIPSEN